MSVEEEFEDVIIPLIEAGQPEQAFNALKTMLSQSERVRAYELAMEHIFTRTDIALTPFINLLSAQTDILMLQTEDDLNAVMRDAADVLFEEGYGLNETILYRYVVAGARDSRIDLEPTIMPDEFEIYTDRLNDLLAGDFAEFSETAPAPQ